MGDRFDLLTLFLEVTSDSQDCWLTTWEFGLEAVISFQAALKAAFVADPIRFLSPDAPLTAAELIRLASQEVFFAAAEARLLRGL